ncbi:MAG TPA: isoprenylcysteine carboxylmethyltransferase family protein [Pseudolabrys sp.]|nr:isoprenylcysteine carboxylmethyltransferase family protein [Pseudolabrys sp.]
MGEGAWLVTFLVVQRLAELCLAGRNTRRLRRLGGIEFGAGHYPLIVTVHAAWIAGLLVLGHDRAVDPFWLSVFVALQIGRLWVIASLGSRWTTRVIVIPEAPPVARGPYRWFRHPNYLIVALEIAVVPMALGMPFYAFLFSAANAALLAHRIRVENEALVHAAAPNLGGKAATLANAGSRR